MVGVSLGTAAVLGLADVQVDIPPTTAYLMIGGRCSSACAFCAQARDSHASALKLSRVTWPNYPQHKVVQALAEAGETGPIRRICIQATAGKDYYPQTIALLQGLHEHVGLPIDVAVLPRDVAQVGELLEAGADHIGFGLDAATAELYRRIKGRSWQPVVDLLEAASREYPGRIAAHVIVGLGETEQEMVDAIQWLHSLGVEVGLFAFTPVRGTAMEKVAPPAMDQYRRMQVAHYLITQEIAPAQGFQFDTEGQLTSFGIDELAGIIPDGACFRTSGCPDCNRPFYNERPGTVPYNYARPLLPAEVAEAWAALGVDLE
jgi:biotin synthase